MADNDQDLVIVHRFNSRPEADLASSALEAAGIASMVLSDDAGGTQPGLWESRGVAVLVNRDEEQAAREILEIPAQLDPP